MTKKFVDIKATDGSRVLLNLDCAVIISPTHGTNMSDGADVLLMTLNEEGVKELSIPASQVQKLLDGVKTLPDQFIEVSVIGGNSMVLNTTYISHIVPLHGSDYSDGAQVQSLGFTVPVSANSALELLALVL